MDRSLMDPIIQQPFRSTKIDQETTIVTPLRRLYMSFLRTNSLNYLPNFSFDFSFSPTFSPLENHGFKFSRVPKRARLVLCSRDGVVGEVGLAREEMRDRAVISECGWSVRRLRATESEKRRVAYVQAKAFHVTMPLFDDLFFDFFKAEVLAALIYRLKNSPADRYCCLVAEADSSVSERASGFNQDVVGVVDLTVMRDNDVMRHLNGDEEYLYVSGIAVLPEFRRRKMGTVLMKACDLMCIAWGYNSLALRAYEEDLGAQNLYWSAGYTVVSRDPVWMTSWVGRKRRVLMIKKLFVQ